MPTKNVFRHGNLASHDFHPNVPYITEPKIIDRKVVDGRLMYYSETKEYYADEFDETFKPKYRFPIRGKFYKGENPDTKNI